MKTTLTILGSGTCVPSLRRFSCSVLIETSGQVLLFDIGPGIMHRLIDAGKSIFDVSYVFLSHTHPDHSGELVSFLFSNKYSTSFSNGRRESCRTKPLTIVGGKGFRMFFQALKTVYGSWIDLPGLLDIVEIDPEDTEPRRFEGFTITFCPVAHLDISIAYRLTDHAGRSIVYSGDTDFCESLITLSKNADILICESALPDALKAKGHLTPSSAGEIASRAGVKKLVLTHFYPECDHEDIEAQCRKTYAGDLVLAEDLMRISLPESHTGEFQGGTS